MEVRPLTIGELKVSGKSLYQEWLSQLDKSIQTEVRKRLAKVRLGNLGVHRNLSGGIIELKFNGGQRIYCGKEGDTLIVLICGGDKASGHGIVDAAIILDAVRCVKR